MHGMGIFQRPALAVRCRFKNTINIEADFTALSQEIAAGTA